MIRIHFIVLVLLAGLTGAVPAFAMPGGIRIDSSGALSVEGIPMQIQCCDAEWKPTLKNEKTVTAAPGYPVDAEEGYELQGLFRIGGGDSFRISESVRRRTPDSVRYHIALLSTPGIFVKGLIAKFSLPHSRFRGKEIAIDGRRYPVCGDSGLLRGAKVIEWEVDGKRVTLSGNFDVAIEDKAKSRGWNFSVMQLNFSRSSGTIHEAELNFDLKITPLHSEAWDFSGEPAARKGTAARELSKRLDLPSGELAVDQLRFPAFSPEKSPRVLLPLGSGQGAEWRPEPGSIPEFLYLVHGVSSDKVRPRIEVEYGDGTARTVEPANGADFDAGFPMTRRTNYAVISSNDKTCSGTGFSAFPLKPGFRKITFRNSGGGEWIIAGAMVSPASIPPKAVGSVFRIVPGGEWVPMEKWKPVKPGSILDMSGTLDAPAGKDGWVRIDGRGHFVTEKNPERRLRFLGTNYAMFGADLDKEEARKTVDDLAALGFNAVRIHMQPLLIVKNGSSQLDFDAEKLDRLDYLYSLLKKKGIYLITDLRCRRIKEADLPGLPDRRQVHALGGVLPVSPEAREFWKTFIRKIFTHYNPYTGLKYCEDPAFFAVILNNEDDIYNSWKSGPEQERLYVEGFRRYLEKRNLFSEANFARRDGLFLEYVGSRYVEMVRELVGFLREDLGYKGLITDFNFRSRFIDNQIRRELDFVDNHCYWDHPRFLPDHSWSFPYLHNQASALGGGAWCPRDVFASRIFGKPFLLSEVNYVFPNRFRAEGGPLLGGYAALQDWDGLFQFAWSHDRDGAVHDSPVKRFDLAEDSLSQLSWRIIWFLFCRGDVMPARAAVGWEFGPDSFRDLTGVDAAAYPSDFQNLGLYCRIGSVAGDRTFPGIRLVAANGKALRNQLNQEENSFLDTAAKISETGQLELNSSRGTFRIVSPGTESLTLSGGALTGDVLSVHDADSFQVITLASLDRTALKSGGKLILFHQSDVTNAGIRFRSESMQAVENWGSDRPLIRRATARVDLKLAPGSYRVRGIGLDGLPKSEVPAGFQNGKLSFGLDTARDGGTMIYSIERQDSARR